MSRMMESYSENPDRWSFSPGLTAIAIVTVIDLCCQLPGSLNLLLMPLTLLGFVTAAIIIVVLAVLLLFRKRPKRGASILLVLLLPLILWRPITRIAEMIHIGLTVNLGIGQLGVAKVGGEGFTVYDWSTGLVTNPSTFLIHDVTDEIALPLAQHTHPASDEAGFGEGCAGKVSRVLKHYYICEI